MKKTLQNLFCSLTAMSLFMFRWANCLPFSGYYPVSQGEPLELWGRYLIWAKEPFSFPKFGIVKSLTFPFQTSNMAHGPVVLFAVVFKALSRLYPPAGHFYYFIFIELVFVLLAGFFTFLILDEFKVGSFWLKLLGTISIALSFPLLYRSTNLAFEVAYVPAYLACAYFYVMAYKHPGFRSYLLLMLIFPVAAMIDDYLLFGISFMMAAAIVLNGVGYLINTSKRNLDRLRGMAAAFILGLLLSSGISYCLGLTGNLGISFGITPMAGRDDLTGVYGGGYGGGFFVADVLSVFIPTAQGICAPENICGPTAYLTKLGFPMTMAKLQHGQYEGFAYAGTVIVGLLFILILRSIIFIFKNWERHLTKINFKLISNFYTVNEFFSLPVILGLSSFSLYVISWGYVIHLGGIRHNDIVTPSLILAEYHHSFIWARALGRLAVAFMLFIAISVIVWLNSAFYRYIYSEKREVRFLCAGALLLLTIVHVSEIWGYLKPPSQVVHGDDITGSFGKQDQALIRNVLHGKSVLMVTPYAMDNDDWGRICYALAYDGGIPMSGPTTHFFAGEILNTGQYDADNKDILSVDIKGLVKRYGEIAIATRGAIADRILANANMPLKAYKLRDRDAVLLTRREG